jgi:hypothetical protein
VSAQATADTLRLSERVEAINRVLGPSLGVLPTPIKIEACSIFLALSRDPESFERLKPEVRSQLAGLTPASCRGRRDIAYTPPIWVIHSIDREGKDRLRVVAHVSKSFTPGCCTYGYTAEYQLTATVHRDGTTSWGVNQVRFYDFVTWVFD